jgi:hypothetical protein
MQTRGPGQSSKETDPGGHVHPEPVQTGAAMTSLSQLGSQHRSVVGGGASQGHSSVEAKPDGHAQPDSMQIGSAGPVKQLLARGLHGSGP